MSTGQSSIDEGVIKFDANDYVKQTMEIDSELVKLNYIRNTLFKMNLIGEYPIEKVGYGNVSIRSILPGSTNSQAFIISGTQTGHIPKLDEQAYTHVINYDFNNNSVSVRGPVQASSESLTHAAIYECHSNIHCVIHVHSQSIWQGMLDENMPHTPKDVPYGTPQMAQAVKDIVNGNRKGVLAMAGHEDGVITFGRSIEEAFKLCEELYKRFS
jgi:ribulose-5-phosphate 4-epimerase/fuculose-1-phosphate aldolase